MRRRRRGWWPLTLLVATLVAAWAVVTQPMLGAGYRGAEMNVDPARLRAHVKMLAETLLPRDHGHPENLNRAAAWLLRELALAGGRVSEQPFVADGKSYRNVIASFGPDGGERVVVGAHYDAFGPLPGADDNASGVAGLIELAGLLGRAAPAKRVDLVGWTLEEPPHFREATMGSQVHAQSLRKDGVKVRGVLSLEMIGCFSDEPGSQRFPLALLKPFYPSAGNFVAVIGKLGGGGLVREVKRAMRGGPIPVHAMLGPRFLPGVDFSDHASYWDAGFPAVMITDTAFYRNPRYHTAEDLPDTLDYERMGSVVKAVYAAVQALTR